MVNFLSWKSKSESEFVVSAVESQNDSEPEGYRKDADGNAFVLSGLKAGVKNRMINLISLCGIIGPGCLIGMGGALAKGGPVGLIVGFTIIGVLVLGMMASIGEMNAVLDANFGVLGSRFVSRGFGAALSLFYVIVWVTV